VVGNLEGGHLSSILAGSNLASRSRKLLPVACWGSGIEEQILPQTIYGTGSRILAEMVDKVSGCECAFVISYPSVITE
jgi:hypothetical protein